MMNRQMVKTAIAASSLALAVGGLTVGGSTTAQAATRSHILANCDKGGIGTERGWAKCDTQGKWTMTVWCTGATHAESDIMDGPGKVELECPVRTTVVTAISTT
jgi:hypothetical protein